MIYIIYNLGIFIWGLALVYLIIINRSDEEELPFPKEAILKIISILLVIGTIFFTVSKAFINMKAETNKNRIELNRTFIK